MRVSSGYKMTSPRNPGFVGRVVRRVRPFYLIVAVLFMLTVLMIRHTMVPTSLELAQGDGTALSHAGRESWTPEDSLIEDIRKNYLHPPSSLPQTLAKPDLTDPSRGQSDAILEVLNRQRNGFYVECGALDGETRSNTLYMERYLDWEGLLVEADPSNFAKVMTKNRHAWSINACLNDKTSKSKVRFRPAFNVGKIAGQGKSPGEKVSLGGTVEVDCFPLHAVLLAMNRTRVDYFSLDVEGAELDVLHSIPFDRIDIRTLSVEYIHTYGGGKAEVKRFMEATGYTVVKEVTQADWTANDFIFVKNSAFPELVKRIREQQDTSPPPVR